VVEGAADCWRIGPGAVGLFGKSLSLPQKALLVHHFAGRPVFVMLDRDAGEDARAVQRALALARSGSPGNNRVLLRELPPGRKDPAECTPQEIAACHVS
jgi:DNA primase